MEISVVAIPELHDVELAETLLGTDFLGWQAQRFETTAGPIDVVPRAAAIGASKEELGRPKDTAALPALYATRKALRRGSMSAS